MKSKLTYSVLTTFAVMFAAMSLQAQTPLFRLAANFDDTPFFERVTSDAPLAGGAGGLVTYQRTVLQPTGKNTLFVTISATMDQHLGAALAMSCNVDGALCGSLTTAGSIGAGGAPAGWIVLGKMNRTDETLNCNDGGGGTGDCHDNVLTYTWCVPNVAPGGRTVQLKLASLADPDEDPTLSFVFYEGAHYYIDSTNFSNSSDACTVANPPE